jgi:hypothetical protein
MAVGIFVQTLCFRVDCYFGGRLVMRHWPGLLPAMAVAVAAPAVVRQNIGARPG